MRNYTNVDTVARIWIHIQKEDGTTLELDPGKSVDLDTCVVADQSNPDEYKLVPIPVDFADPWLKPEKKARKESQLVQEKVANA